MHALNELTFETGWFTSKFTIEIYINDYFLSTLSAAGLILSTTTGSTAYNMSAGGSIMQTEVEAISIKPILAWNRSLVLPPHHKITIKVPEDKSIKPFFGCIDGDFRFMMNPGDTINISGSESPVPFVQTSMLDPIEDWIQRLKTTILSYQ